jgi:GNAT superfamily N-acetyltransferase
MLISEDVEYFPLTLQRWADFEALMGKKGAYGGCWCMFWHLTRAEFSKASGEQNKQAMLTRLKLGQVPGILIYDNQTAVAWCAVAPRSAFAALERSRIFKRVDQAAVWSIVCFFIKEDMRNKGLMLKAIRAAVAYARQNGARILEAYPVEYDQHCSPLDLYMGVAQIFRKAGFQEVKRPPSSRHVIMRLNID